MLFITYCMVDATHNQLDMHGQIYQPCENVYMPSILNYNSFLFCYISNLYRFTQVHRKIQNTYEVK